MENIIRQAAFTGNAPLLKGGLHCHTTRSDGQCTPEETEQLHIDNGYDFLALTDHHTYNYKNYLPDSDLLIIPGMEHADYFDCDHGVRHYHTVCIGPDNATNGFAQDERTEAREVTGQEDFQRSLDHLHSKNNLSFYCHPEWSCTPARYFDRLKGQFGMEIWNSGCAIEMEKDTNAAYWDELLGMGIRLWGIATDDGHAREHHCKGWVRVNAEKNVCAILEALKNGAFYSSCGPEIYDFYVENGQAHVKCSPCKRILFYCDKHNDLMHQNADGTPLEYASVGLRNKLYIRACVVDFDGNRAWTNPIFLD